MFSTVINQPFLAFPILRNPPVSETIGNLPMLSFQGCESAELLSGILITLYAVMLQAVNVMPPWDCQLSSEFAGNHELWSTNIIGP